MAELVPIGSFNISVFAVPGSLDGFATQIQIPPDSQMGIASWIEAAATLSSYVARHSNIGYEKTLELVTEQTMRFRDGPPKLMDSPDPPDFSNSPDYQNPPDEPETPEV